MKSFILAFLFATLAFQGIAQKPAVLDTTTTIKPGITIPDTLTLVLGEDTLTFIGADANALQASVTAAIKAYKEKNPQNPGEWLLLIISLIGLITTAITQVVKVAKQVQGIFLGIKRPNIVAILISGAGAVLWTGFSTGWAGWDWEEFVRIWGAAYLISQVAYEVARKLFAKKTVAAK